MLTANAFTHVSNKPIIKSLYGVERITNINHIYSSIQTGVISYKLHLSLDLQAIINVAIAMAVNVQGKRYE